MAFPFSPEDLGELYSVGDTVVDSKIFVDAVPRMDIPLIRQAYTERHHRSDFSLPAFLGEHFEVSPDIATDNDPSYLGETASEHIEAMWPRLTRVNPEDHGTLIGLKYPYITPSVGPYFQEQYYWDTFFTNLGLWESGQYELALGQVRNLASMIEQRGYAPNGNRTYYKRTQDPLFALMVKDVVDHFGEKAYLEFLPALLIEDAFFRRGEDELMHAAGGTALNRLVVMPGGEILDRVYCDSTDPRPERRAQDILTATLDPTRTPEEVYRDIGAGAGSGRDFFSGLMKDGKSLHTIHTTHLISVQRNSYRIRQREIIADALTVAARHSDSLEDSRSLLQQADDYRRRAAEQAEGLMKYCWNKEKGFLFDYDFVANEQKTTWHMGSVAALFAGILSPEQAEQMGQHLENDFMRAGGYAASLHRTEHMWDGSDPMDTESPAFGWAPDQYTAFHGLLRYNQDRRAYMGAQRWVSCNNDVYGATGRMYENYNVNHRVPGQGGEKPVQTGFGWTNGVYLHLKAILDKAGLTLAV